jgi:protein O-mannosyl-transferase
MFYLLAVLSFLRYWDFTRPATEQGDVLPSQTKTWRWLIAAYVCFVAALLSKTVTATLPAAILVLIWWKQGRIPFRKSLCLLPMFIIGVVFGLFTVWLEKYHVGASGIDWELTLWERCLVAGRAIVFYAAKVFWPTNLIFIYPRWQIDSKEIWQSIFPLAVLAAMVVLWLKRNSIGRGPLAAVFLFAGTLFPALGFFDVYPMRFSFVADHFQYLASIAMITLGVSVATIWANRVFEESMQVMKFAAVTVIAVLMILTALQTQAYEGVETLWRDTLQKNPECFLAHNNLGAILTRRGDLPEAEKHLREAIRIKPDFTDSIVNMGKVLEVQGDIDGAIKFYSQATQMDPFYAPALNGLGAMYGAKGDMRSAEMNFQQAVQSNPEYVSARINLASILMSRQDFAAAKKHLESALKFQPDSKVVQDKLMEVYASTGNYEAASALLQAMLVKTPDDVALLGAAGMMMARQKKFPEAISFFERVLELHPNLPEALFSLAEVYREQGNREKSEQYLSEFEKYRK